MSTIYITRDLIVYPLSSGRRWGENKVELKKGSRYETIYWGHLPKETLEGVDKDIIEDVKTGRYLIIYFKRQYLLVSRLEVDLVKW